MSDPDPEYLTVPEVAALLRLKERKIYDLAASGELPVSRATGKLLFPKQDIQTWVEAKSSVPTANRETPNVLLGSHDPLLEWAVRQSQCGLASLLEGSRDGLSRFHAGDGAICGLHIFEAATNTWNTGTVGQKFENSNAVLIHWAKRRRGLVTRNDFASSVNSIEDLANHRLVARQPASGAHILQTHLLQKASIDPASLNFTASAHSEQDAVLAVSEGAADVAFGLESLAHSFNLKFTALIDEQFDLLVDRRAYFQPNFQTLLAFCGSPDFKDRAAHMGGYDVSQTGQVRWNA